MKPVRISKEITKEDIQKAIPSRKGTITDEIVEIINASQMEPEFQGETLLHTATTYEAVLVRNKASIKQYLNAIRFCAYLLSTDDNYTEAYKKAFFDTDFVKDRLGVSTSDTKYIELASAASRYRKSRLVTEILTVSQVPLELMFMGARQKAVMMLADMMYTAKYDRDKISAADKLLQHTAGTQTHKIELDIGMKESSAVQELSDQLARLAGNQKLLLETGNGSLEQFGSMKVRDEYIEEAEVM